MKVRPFVNAFSLVRHFVCIVLLICAGLPRWAQAQGGLPISLSSQISVPDGNFSRGDFYEATQNLTDAMDRLSRVINETGGNLHDFVPLVRSIQTITGVTQQFYTLAEYNVPGFQRSVGQVGMALTQIAAFVDSLDESKVKIACASIGVIAAGLVLGNFLNNHVFILNSEKNVFARLARFTYRGVCRVGAAGRSCCRWMGLPRPRDGEELRADRKRGVCDVPQIVYGDTLSSIGAAAIP